MENQELVNHDANIFGSASSFEHAQRVAQFLSQSDLVPDTFKGKVGNCLIALEMANRIGASPMMVMQNMYVVYGKPSWSSTFLIACLNKSGQFTSLRYEESNAKGGSCRAFATDNSGEVCYGPWVTMEMAKAEGWMNKKGSKWLTMPGLMIRYRAAAFFQRQFAPEISMGFHTVDEIRDIGPPKDAAGNTAVTVRDSKLKGELESASSLDELLDVWADNMTEIKKDVNLLKLYADLKDEYETEPIIIKTESDE